MTSGKVFTTNQACPFQCSTREITPVLVKPSVKAQTSFGDVAAALMTVSSFLPGNCAFVQAPLFSTQAVGLAVLLPLESKAQAVVLPVATSAVKTPFLGVVPGTDLAMCHDSAAVFAVLAVFAFLGGTGNGTWVA
jgi:hypothetical protein